MSDWDEATKWESAWHGNCVNSYQEESKQIEYAKRMGLNPVNIDGRYPVYDMGGKTVLDVGGGPYSMLLKCINVKGTVVDPGNYPSWVEERYKAAGITYIKMKAEVMNPVGFDEIWMYNCLQHTENPRKICKKIKAGGKILRIHEWLDTPISDGHIQTIREEKLNKWFDIKGMVGYERWSDTVVTPYYFGMFLL